MIVEINGFFMLMCLHPIQTSVALTSELRVVYCFMFPSLSETPSHPLVSLLLVCHVHIQCTCMYLSVSFSFFDLFLGGLCLPLLTEGDYWPWDRELQSGLWLEKYLTDEEDVGTFKGSNGSACGCVCSYFE